MSNSLGFFFFFVIISQEPVPSVVEVKDLASAVSAHGCRNVYVLVDSILASQMGWQSSQA